MKIFRRYLLLLFIQIGILNSLFAQIPETPDKPNLETAVYDDAGLMSLDQKNALESKLIQYADSTSTQIVVVTVNTTGGEDIGYYATQWGHKWGVGQKDKDNGVIILVAKDDRKMTIRTGYGVEHLLTDALSRRIIETVMVPNFKQGNYYEGLNEATDVIFQIMSGEYQADPVTNDDGFIAVLIIILIFIVVIIIIASAFKNNGNNKGGRSFTDDDVFGPIILSRGGRGSWGGGWSSGGSGGFGGGFGGGGFGGGGASGGW